MKVIEIRNSFGIKHLTHSERPKPIPGAGEVLIRMKSVSLNYRDLMTIEGRYNPHQPLPLIPCSDGVGEVIEIGDGVSRAKVGDRVATTFFQGWISGEPTMEKVTYFKYLVNDEVDWSSAYSADGFWNFGGFTEFYQIKTYKIPVGCAYRYQY